MVDIIKVLNENEKEAKGILSFEIKDGVLTFANWDAEEELYGNADDCPYIRYANDEGEIRTQLVVAARFNESSDRIEIITTESEYEISDGVWFPLEFADDISRWSVIEAIGNHADYEQ